MAKATKKAAAKKKPAAKPDEQKIAPEANGNVPNGEGPSLKILGQYLKDLSFENPNAPASLASQESQPEINISVNVNARNLAPSDYEVELHLEAQATTDGKSVFAADMLYAGIFRLENLPEEAVHPVVLVECPRMIFPFARQILAEATRNGGFPPLMLDPIDFASMYQRRMAEESKDDKAGNA